jgi:peptidoglycan/LPS O-acetylase OafA/YrhL
MTTEASKAESAAPVYVPAFDAFRGFAVLAILVYHLMLRSEWVPARGTIRALFVTGPMSLDVLFLISGFVLFLPVAARGSLGSSAGFFLRRYMRIAPAFYVSLLVALVLFPLLVTDTHSAGLPPHDALAVLYHALFIHNEVSIAFDAYYPGFGVNPAVWTLSVEIIFYLLLPLVATRYRRHPLLGLGIAIAVTVAWRILLDPGAHYLQNAIAPSDRHQVWKQFPLFAVDFAAGMTTAALYIEAVRGRLRALRNNAAAAAGVSLVALVALLLYTGTTLTGSRDPLTIAGTGFQEPVVTSIVFPLLVGLFMLSISLAPARWQRPVTNRVSRKLGDISYGVYLYHLLVISFAAATLGFAKGSFGDFLLYAVFALPLSLLLGWLSLTVVERPARRWGRKVARRFQRPSDPAATSGAATSIMSGSSGTR